MRCKYPQARGVAPLGISAPGPREYFDCADHVLALTHVAVAEHLHAAGFSVGTVVPWFLPYSFRSKFPASPPLARAYLRHPVLWRLAGKQFLVTGSR